MGNMEVHRSRLYQAAGGGLQEDDHGRADVLLLHVEKVSERPAGPS